MRHALALALILAAVTPAAAQQDDASEGLGLLQEGARSLLRGLMEELEPALRNFSDTVGDLSAYHLPEILPNGDIIIRRRVPLVPEPGAEEVEI